MDYVIEEREAEGTQFCPRQGLQCTHIWRQGPCCYPSFTLILLALSFLRWGWSKLLSCFYSRLLGFISLEMVPGALLLPFGMEARFAMGTEADPFSVPVTVAVALLVVTQ